MTDGLQVIAKALFMFQEVHDSVSTVLVLSGDLVIIMTLPKRSHYFPLARRNYILLTTEILS